MCYIKISKKGGIKINLSPETQTLSGAGTYRHSGESERICFPPHRHQRLEFLVVTQGKYCFTTPDQTDYFEPGDVCMINSYVDHEGVHCLQPGEQGQYHYVQISLQRAPRLCEELNRLLTDLEEKRILLPFRVPAETAKAIGLYDQLLALAAVFKQPNGLNEFNMIVKTLQIFQTIAAHRLYTVSDLQSQSIDPFVREVAAYLDDRYAEDLHIETVAKQWGYEPHYFCTLFKKHFHTTFTHYLRRVRINKFLSHPRLSLQTIADCATDVGFSNYSYFYHCFRRRHNCSPREYLTRLRR